jgi:hypothetical protein
LAEALRLGTGPAGFILDRPDSILVIGSLVANRLYGSVCPIVVGPMAPGSTGMWSIDQNHIAPLPGHTPGSVQISGRDAD